MKSRGMSQNVAFKSRNCNRLIFFSKLKSVKILIPRWLLKLTTENSCQKLFNRLEFDLKSVINF